MTTLHALYGPRLQAAAAAMGLDISNHQEKALIDYLGHLQRWNRTYNLTALRDPEQMLIQHLFDSLAVVRPIIDLLDKHTVNPVIVDVGSGAGLPGVVLAIMNSGATLHCVDTVEKKATFIRYVAGALRLANLHAHHARIETLPSFGADIVVSRAFASLSDFVELAASHVHAQGWMLAMKGQEPKDEIAALHRDTIWRATRVVSLQVPELDARRCLVWMTQEGTV